jgi:hypothetical protein
MIDACNHAEPPSETGVSVDSPVTPPGECETFAAEVRHSPEKKTKKAAARRQPQPAADATPGSDSEWSDIQRDERELVKELRQRLREARFGYALKPRKKDSCRTESETFTSGVRHEVPPAATSTSDTTASQDAAEVMLHDKQPLALSALVQGASVVEAAQAAGVNRRTVHRWLQQPQFQAELHQAQRSFCISLRTKAANLTDESVNVIEEMLGRGSLYTALNLLKSIDILNGQSLATIDGLATVAAPDPAVVFPAPSSAVTTSPTGTTSSAAVTETEPNAASPATPGDEPATPVPPVTAAPALAIDDLPLQQQVVITALVQGKLVPEAAGLAGATIAKVLRWKKSDPAFRQVLIGCRQEQHRQLRAKLLHHGIRALDILWVALKKYRNVRVAFAILKGVGVLASKK